MWAVVDDVWVVNVTGFLPHHPGGAAILGANLSAHFSFAHGREAHFRSTAEVFAEATAAFDAQPSKPPRYRWYLGCILLKVPAVSLLTGAAPMDFVFWRSRENGGLSRAGRPVGPRPSKPVGTATIMGRLAAQ